MSVYRRGDSPFYWCKLYYQGDVVRFSTGERTKVAALRKEGEKARDLKRKQNVEGRYSIATLAAKFILWKQGNNRAPQSIAGMKKHINLHLLPFFGDERDIRTIEASDLEDFKLKRCAAVSAGTVCKELSTLRQMLKYAANVHRIIERAPTISNPTFRYEPKWRLLAPAELDRLIEACARRQRRGRESLPYFLLLANTGMRGGELSQVTWDMVDVVRCSIFLPAPITKTRRPRTVPLNDQALLALQLLAREGAVGRLFLARSHYGSWRKSCEEAGVGRVRPHDLRHTFASLLHASGATQPEVRDILGHSTLHMANLYAHTYDAALHQAVARVQVNVPASVPLKGETVPVLVSFGQNGFNDENRKTQAN